MDDSLTYQPLWWLKNRHLNTIVPNRIRKFPQFSFDRERIETPDNDFIDLDWYWSKRTDSEVVLLLHGLEGSSQSGYMIGLSKLFHQLGYHVCCMNFRGCSGEPNEQLVSYHSGKQDDVITTLKHIEHKGFTVNGAVGFSLGGNLLLRYLGDEANQPISLKHAVAISAPVDLSGSCDELQLKNNQVYRWHFLRKLKVKAKQKQTQFPEAPIDWDKVYEANSLRAFDDAFTAPIHGFDSAADYYEKCSSLALLDQISIPTLIINAKDDSFLSDTCYPTPSAFSNWNICYPLKGGHVGFIDAWPITKAQWHERVIESFWKN